MKMLFVFIFLSFGSVALAKDINLVCMMNDLDAMDLDVQISDQGMISAKLIFYNGEEIVYSGRKLNNKNSAIVSRDSGYSLSDRVVYDAGFVDVTQVNDSGKYQVVFAFDSKVINTDCSAQK